MFTAQIEIMYTIQNPSEAAYEKLMNIWEASVRATHHFLTEDDIRFFKKLILEKNYLNHVDLYCIRTEQNVILGFSGISGNKLEMLFLDPTARGLGLGKLLLIHAIDHLYVSEVDVNEQNIDAVAFYEHFGFKTISRSALDGTGKPFPILHMALTKRV